MLHLRPGKTLELLERYLYPLLYAWCSANRSFQLLHLHPLTLEDILQQDPREKLDLFPKLGYYFISFRAIETRESRKKSQQRLQKMNEYLEPIVGHGEGTVGEANVYLVVFSEGICCVRTLVPIVHPSLTSG